MHTTSQSVHLADCLRCSQTHLLQPHKQQLQIPLKTGVTPLPISLGAVPGESGGYMSSEYTDNGGVAPWTDMFLGDSNIDWIGLSDILTGQ
jgi:hypothetical protein